MTTVRLKGIHRVKKTTKVGVVQYHYAYRGGPCFWSSNSTFKIGSAAYINAFRDASENTLPTNGRKFQQILNKYQASPEFLKLAAKTRKDYIARIRRIEAKFGNAPIAVFNDPRIRAQALEWRDQWTGRQAQYYWAVLRRIVSWAYNRGLLTAHHLKGGEANYSSNRADIIWTAEDIELFAHNSPQYLVDALTAATETGMRPADLVKLTSDDIQATDFGSRIVIKTSKSRHRRQVSIPVSAKMSDVIKRAPEDGPILRNSVGEPWTSDGVASMVMIHARKLGIRRELRFYDARGTAATRLYIAGATLSELAAFMGWSIKTASQMLERYAEIDLTITDQILKRLKE